MHKLIELITAKIELKAVKHGIGLNELEDAALITMGKETLAFTTDSFTVSPLFFPGGDIGKLAVYGTANDLAVMGAKPLALSLAFIVEEGLQLDVLEQVLDSINNASKTLGLPIVTGDTKVMERSKLDKLVINTAGIGVLKKPLLDSAVKSGDIIVVTGPIGMHGIALLAERFDFECSLTSDCAPVWPDIEKALSVADVHAAKDPTRGGLAACLNELASKSGTCFHVFEERLPIEPEAKAIAEMLGVDILHTASEGMAVLCVAEQDRDALLDALPNARVIGHAEPSPAGKVVLHTMIGAKVVIDKPAGELYPRIC
jgi:hydrogenase expression/formation protein HypE